MTKIDQLIDTFQPNHYDLSLKLERLTRKFSGTVTIHGEYKNTQPIKVHSKQLTVTKTLVNDLPAAISYGENDETTLTPSSQISLGDMSLTLEFTGEITDSQHGIYPCYFEHDGEKKEFLATQFEPHHAREAFPCIDEPSAKATFSLTLETEDEVTTLSNMPIRAQETIQPIPDDPDAKRLVTTFETTPKMSTYLLAFAVGEMHSVEAKTSGGIDVRIWSAPTQRKESLKFALETAVRAVEFFDEYFGTAYPLPKADHIALPDMGGGASAAMENWGLITYREDCLIAEDSAGISVRQRIAEVIVHETSHQWFGNLVTMKWWDDLWLNESFASLMEYVCLENLFPEWHYWHEFVSSETLPALRRDSNPGVQSIKMDVNHPDEIGTLFDGAIVYAKGATVLRMLMEYVGEIKFREGLQTYFAKHAYSNTTGQDLWNALDPKASGFITPWLEKSGFPVINVTKTPNGYTLEQEELLIGAEADKSKVWPLLLAANDPSLPSIMDTKSLSAANNGPLQLNAKGKAQYVVNYDTESRAHLIEKVNDQSLDLVDRLRLLLETTLLIRTPHLASSELVALLEAYKQETSQPVWDMIAFGIGVLKAIVDDNERAEQGLRSLARRLSHSEATRLGWQEKSSEPETDKKLRATALSLSLYGEDKITIRTACELYERYKDNIASIDGELRSLVIAAAVRHGESSTIVEDLIKLHDTTQSSEIQEDIISGLSGTRDPEVIKQLLNIMSDAERVRPQNAIHWFIYCLRNRYGRELAWEWMRNNWGWVEKTYGSDKSYDIFPRVTANILSTPTQLKEYEAFFAPFEHDLALKRAITIGKSEIRARIDWLASDKQAVVDLLSKY